MTITHTAADVRDMLADGKTLQEVVDATRWPHQQVKAVGNGQGWLWDANGCAYDPRDADRRRPSPRPSPRPSASKPVQQPAAPERPAPATAMQITMIPIDRIHPHPKNIRNHVGDVTELADSIRSQGLLQPLVVQPAPGAVGDFLIIAGERRHAAAKLARVSEVPTVVIAAATDDTAIEQMLVENCHRADLTPMEKAVAFGALKDHGYSQTSIAKRTGFSSSTVAYYLTLLDLDDTTQQKVREGELPAATAVTAVRKTRTARKTRGSAPRYRWEPDHLSGRHPLAKKAGRLCDNNGHTMRRRLGDTACGQCWETVIRMDERTVMAAAGGA